jgi:tetratricopeptide (TPR) repeat protein
VRRHRFLLFLAAVFAAKLVVVLQLRDHPLLQRDSGFDTTIYAGLAADVAAGNTWLAPGLYFVSPLYIYFLAGIFSLANAVVAARLVQIVIGTAAVWCVFVAARVWSGERAAWLAALFAGLTGLFTFHEALLLPSALDPCLTAAALAALACGLEAHDRMPEASGTGHDVRTSLWFAAAGIGFGALVLNRPNALLPAVAVAGMLAAFRRLKPATWLAAGLVVALLPLAIRNVAVAGDWSPLSSHGGLGFYIGNNPESDGTYHPVPGITPDIQGQQLDARHVAEASVGRTMGDGEVSRYFYALGWSWIRLHPGDAALHLATKLFLVFNAGLVSPNYSYRFYAYDAGTLLPLLFAGPWLLLPLGLVGLALGAMRDRGPGYLIWVSFVPLYALSVALFFVTERHRLPLLVPLCAGAGAAVDFLIFRTGFQPSRLARALALGAILLVTVLTSWPHRRDDGRAEERTRMAEAMIVRDRIEEAETWATRAEAIHPRPSEVHLRVGRLLTVHSRPAAALVHLQRALTLNPADSDVQYAMGQALVEAKRPREAIPRLRDALKAGVRLNLAGYDLARALAATGDRAGALQTLQAVRPDSPSDVQSWSALGQLAMQLESPSLAAAFFSEAVAASPRASRPRQELGRALSIMGRRLEAIAQFEQATALDPADPAAQFNLAVAYAGAGRSVEARARAQEALRLKPDYLPARQFLRTLK